jgi:hypothetical protein
MAGQIADGKSIYVVQQDSTYKTAVEWVPGFDLPVKLSLVTRDHQVLGRAFETHQQEANLVICMEKEVALAIFSQIRTLARTMDWPLPTEDENPA